MAGTRTFWRRRAVRASVVVIKPSTVLAGFIIFPTEGENIFEIIDPPVKGNYFVHTENIGKQKWGHTEYNASQNASEIRIMKYDYVFLYIISNFPLQPWEKRFQLFYA